MSPRFTRPALRVARSAESVALLADVVAGLQSSPPTLPPKLFYDARGAELFERICELPEYYLTRAELEILHRHAGDVAALAGPRCALIEYGSGAGVKIRLLLDALESPVSYVPVDISMQQLAHVSASLAGDYPDLAVRPVCADYTRPFAVPEVRPRVRRLAFFPGSTIGNFHPAEAIAFLARIRRVIGRDGLLVLGVDRRKGARALRAAYNDAAGVTAEFNRNMLARLNREIGADFDVAAWRHRAVWNAAASRVEMHLEAARRQRVRVGGHVFDFAAGDTIWTESSYKYQRASVQALASAAGFRVLRWFTDARRQFWVLCLGAAPASRRREE